MKKEQRPFNMEDKESKGLGDILKKVVNTGISAASITEDAVSGILQNAKNTKDEFVNSVKNEFKNYLSKIDITKEIDRVLEKYDLEISANIKFKKKDSNIKKGKKGE